MHSRQRLVALLIFALITAALVLGSQPARAFEAPQRSGFPKVLPTGYVRFGSPTLADITGDGRLEILVGTTDGYLHAVTHTGATLWSADISGAIDARAVQVGLNRSVSRIPIRTKPAVGTVNGRIIIAVTAGDVFPAGAGDPTWNGAAVVLNAQGQVLPGWPQFPLDFIGGGDPTNPGGPDGHSDGILSSPAIGDITGDGVPEIIYGANDQRVYAKSIDGKDLAGWPQWILDTVWASPSIADIDGDGINEAVIGVDAHFYRGPPRFTEDGGDLYVFKGNGDILWRASQDEIFQSSTAVADLNGDGKPEIAAGTGTFYGNIGRVNATGERVGQYFTVWKNNGDILWRTPLPERVFGSPAIGDITGDGKPEVVVGALDGKVYAFDGATGRIIWSSLARDIFNNQFLPNPQVFSPVLGDFTGNGVDDVFIAIGWDVAVMRGSTGELLTGTSNLDPNKPSYYTSYSINGTPAIGDLDGNGKLELVAASASTNGQPPFNPVNARINVWNLTSSTAKASWPQFRRTADNQGKLVPRLLSTSTRQIGGMLEPGDNRDFAIRVSATDGSTVTWTVQESDSSGIITLSRTTGDQGDDLVVTVGGNRAVGNYTARLTIKGTGMPDVTINVNLTVAENIQQVYVPLMRR